MRLRFLQPINTSLGLKRKKAIDDNSTETLRKHQFPDQARVPCTWTYHQRQQGAGGSQEQLPTPAQKTLPIQHLLKVLHLHHRKIAVTPKEDRSSK